MKRTALLPLFALAALASGMTWSADEATDRPTDRAVSREYTFGDVRFVAGAGKAMPWLEMYVDGDFIGTFRDFDVTNVVASPDGQYFLAVSNAWKSALAFAILDRKGHMVASAAHGGDLHYCERTSWGIGEWVDASNPQATFSIRKNQMTTPATDFLSVTARGCDGKTVLLARPLPPEKLVAPARQPLVIDANTGVVITGTRIATAAGGQDRSSFFIGETIANLRGLDPTFGVRTLTLVDGRRVVRTTPASGPTRALALPEAWTAAPVLERRNCPRTAQCGGNADLLVERPDGSTQVIATGAIGDFVALPRAARIFDCAWDVSSGEPAYPSVIALNGDRISLPAHPGPVRVCARTGSGDEVLLVYGLAEAGRSHSLARVFDANGTLLAERNFEARGVLQFSVAGTPYTAVVPGP